MNPAGPPLAAPLSHVLSVSYWFVADLHRHGALNYSSEGYIDKKNDRRLDDCLRYALVSGHKASSGLAAARCLDARDMGPSAALVIWYVSQRCA